ncbi:MAG TPA: tripartite tricarboxylate transporter substrate binding protein [Ramlibacter sp.]|nr:tripartite tricarboxylate transporter substrate binding protein [Ramlibacter sp.]
MKTTRRAALAAMAAGIGLGMFGAPARGQNAYPSQAIRFLVPFTAGSGTDIVARTVADQLVKALGQPVIIENKPGAGGTVGAGQVALAPADGHTVLIHSAAHVANAALYRSLRYDTLKDFTPVTMLATLPNVLVTAPGKDFKTVQELVQKAKAHPGKYMYASAGNGSATHMNAEKFRAAVGIAAVHVPFKGTPEALTEVMSGRLDWFFAPLISALPLIKDGKLTPLAVGTPKRSSVLPDVPTTLEAGYPNSDYTFWVGMFVPAKTPAPVVAKLHEETSRALQVESVRDRLRKLGAELAPMPQAEFASLVQTEASAAAGLIKRANIRID